MKVIDIMQKVANKEIFKFRIDDENYYVDKSNYICEEDGTKVEWYIDDEWLNMNAEIIEEDEKISKDIKWYLIEEQEKEKTKIAQINLNFRLLREKVEEIIDYINKEK